MKLILSSDKNTSDTFKTNNKETQLRKLVENIGYSTIHDICFYPGDQKSLWRFRKPLQEWLMQLHTSVKIIKFFHLCKFWDLAEYKRHKPTYHFRATVLSLAIPYVSSTCVHSGFHLSKKVIHTLRRPARTTALVPLWTCVAAAKLPACLPAWRQLGSRVLWSEAPLGSPDWLESHLPNRLAPCHQTIEQQRGSGGVKKERERKKERALIWQREKETRHK